MRRRWKKVPDGWNDGELDEATDDWSDDDFEKMMEDLRIARKLNRQANVLSVIALAGSIMAVIIRILMAR